MPTWRNKTAEHEVCDEILDIMREYKEQENSASGVDTPGGLEHMGDVWKLFHKWESKLKSPR
jgi:hypothetical protein